MTIQQARKLIASLLAAFPNQAARFDDEQIEAMVSTYRMLLADIDEQALATACMRLCVTSKWFPSVAEIRSAVVEQRHGIARTGGEAWGDVIAAISRYGAYREPRFEDLIVERCVAALGWQELCNSEFPTADRARFVEMYAQLVERERVDAATRTLPGAGAAVARGGLPAPAGVGEYVAQLMAGLGKTDDESDPDTRH